MRVGIFTVGLWNRYPEFPLSVFSGKNTGFRIGQRFKHQARKTYSSHTFLQKAEKVSCRLQFTSSYRGVNSCKILGSPRDIPQLTPCSAVFSQSTNSRSSHFLPEKNQPFCWRAFARRRYYGRTRDAFRKPWLLRGAVSADALALMRRIDELHLDYPFAGSWVLQSFLAREGYEVGRLHVATLMKRMGIEAIYRQPNTSKPAPGHTIFLYLLRKLPVTRPNQVWAMDITYIPMARGFVWHGSYR